MKEESKFHLSLPSVFAKASSNLGPKMSRFFRFDRNSMSGTGLSTAIQGAALVVRDL